MREVESVIDRLKVEGIYYSDETYDLMDKVMGIVSEKLGISQYQFEVELAMTLRDYESFEESAEFIGSNGLWDVINPKDAFDLIWERLVAIEEINKTMADNFFSNNTRDILNSCIDRAKQLIENDF